MELLEKARHHNWYHTLELGPDLTTSGIFDLRPYIDQYGLPASLEGKRCLEVGTWDGFWAFELERRGAAEVVAIDLDDERELDWPPRRRPREFPDAPRGSGFALAKEIYGSSVERVVCSVYDATPEELGTFDFVFCGTVLIHLRDQLLALERIANLCDDLFITAEEHDWLTGLLPFPVSRYRTDRDKSVVFWEPSAKTWKSMLWSAGFDRVTEHGRFTMHSNEGYSVPHVVHHAHKAG